MQESLTTLLHIIINLFKKRKPMNQKNQTIKSGNNSTNMNVCGDKITNIQNNINNYNSNQENPNLILIAREIIKNETYDVERIAENLGLNLNIVEDHLDELNSRKIIITLSGGSRKVFAFEILNESKLIDIADLGEYDERKFKTNF